VAGVAANPEEPKAAAPARIAAKRNRRKKRNWRGGSFHRIAVRMQVPAGTAARSFKGITSNLV
jgi:hypothetical protein